MLWCALISRAAARIGHQAWDLWPRPGVFSGIARSPAPSVARMPALRHIWRLLDGMPGTGRYVCVGCQRKTTTLDVRITMAPCPGATGAAGFPAMMRRPQGHDLAAIYSEQGGLPTLACITCGGWSTGRKGKLSRACRRPNVGGRAAVRRMARGCLPASVPGLGDVPFAAAYWVHMGEVSSEQLRFGARGP